MGLSLASTPTTLVDSPARRAWSNVLYVLISFEAEMSMKMPTPINAMIITGIMRKRRFGVISLCSTLLLNLCANLRQNSQLAGHRRDDQGNAIPACRVQPRT